MKNKNNNWILSFGVLSLAIGLHQSAFAAVCNTIDDCRVLQSAVEAQLAALLEKIDLQLTTIARNADGSINYLKQEEADRYCKKQGNRLPTARELALYAQLNGARGISEIKKEGYDLIDGTDGAGHLDHFYYSSKGYRHPSGDDGKVLFWSSSFKPNDPEGVYGLVGYNGDLELVSSAISNVTAVRCVDSR